MSQNFGSESLVVGANYGMRDWLSQRVTAILMALVTVLVLARLLLTRGPIGYDTWAGLCTPQWMKALTFAAIASLGYHAWVGVRNVLMDYVKPVGTRLVMQVFTIVWLVSCAGWSVQVLWRL